MKNEHKHSSLICSVGLLLAVPQTLLAGGDSYNPVVALVAYPAWALLLISYYALWYLPIWLAILYLLKGLYRFEGMYWLRPRNFSILVIAFLLTRVKMLIIHIRGDLDWRNNHNLAIWQNISIIFYIGIGIYFLPWAVRKFLSWNKTFQKEHDIGKKQNDKNERDPRIKWN